MVSNEFAGGHRELTATLLDTDESCLLIDPSAAVLGAVADLATDASTTLPKTDVLAESDTLKTARDRFQVATGLAEGVADGHLRLRVLDEAVNTTLLATPETVYAIVDGGDTVGALASDTESFVSHVHESYQARFADADGFDLRRPALSEALETLGDELGAAVADEFEQALASADRVVGLDAVVALLVVVTARHDGLLYDLSQWSEDVGLASKATVSRRKTRLEDTGLIGTEKQPVEVGRPRLRLVTTPDSELAETAPAELWELTHDHLSE